MAKYYKNSYIDGNRVPGAQAYVNGTAVPKPREEILPELPERRAIGERTSRNREHVGYVNLAYVVFVTLISVMLLFACVSLLEAHAAVTTQQKLIQSRTAALQTLKADNDAEELRLDASVNLEEIYHTATEKYGMIYPQEDRIITYDRTEGTYVRQYEDIPTD